MYVPDDFAEPSLPEIHRIVREHPLAMLVTHGAAGLDANHLPFELDEDRGVLTAHIARANPLHEALVHEVDAMAVFRGAQGYISPNWYPSKHETHRHVPTWNYEVVHAHGRLRLVDNERFVRGVVGRLTRRHEAAQPVPWRMSDAPRDFLETLLAAIVGIELQVERFECKRKLGQNRTARDAEGAIAALGDAPLAAAMARTRR